MKVTAIILSGGTGKRFGSDIPKQYIKIKEKCLLQYTLAAFEQSDADEILITAADEYLEYCRTLARDCGCQKPVRVIPGGRERYDSVFNALSELRQSSGGIAPDDIVLIHDGARPFIRPKIIRELIGQVKECGAAIAAAPCTDTIKIADPQRYILSTTERSLTWAAQTPQAFFAGEICQAYEKVIGGGYTDGVTDDAMVFQTAFPDKPVKLVNAGPENFKITTRMDLFRAEGMISGYAESCTDQ